MLRNRFTTVGASLPAGYDRSRSELKFSEFGRDYLLVGLTRGGGQIVSAVLLMETNQERQWASIYADLELLAYETDSTQQFAALTKLEHMPEYLKACADKLGTTDIYDLVRDVATQAELLANNMLA